MGKTQVVGALTIIALAVLLTSFIQAPQFQGQVGFGYNDEVEWDITTHGAPFLVGSTYATTEKSTTELKLEESFDVLLEPQVERDGKTVSKPIRKKNSNPTFRPAAPISIADASGDQFEAEIIVEKKQNLIPLHGLPNNVSKDVIIKPKKTPIKQIAINDLPEDADLGTLKIHDTDEKGPFVEVYSIDPTEMNFEEAEVTVVATGKTLFKCVDWNFETQTCEGEWKLFKDGLVPGQEYTFTLTPEDPGFAEIIEVTNAIHLGTDRNPISNIFQEVSAQDDIWSETINENEFVRVTFEELLTGSKDITLYPRIISGTPRIEVYEKNDNTVVATFVSLNENEYNTVFLTELENPQDVFDLKVVGGTVQFDHIIDPSPSTYVNGSETVVNGGTSLVLNRPNGTTSGDLLIAIIANAESEDNTFTAPGGWTQVVAETGVGQTPPSIPGAEVYRKVANSSEPTSYTFTASFSSGLAGHILTFRNVGNTSGSPIGQTATAQSSTTGCPVAPSITTNYANETVVFIGFTDDDEVPATEANFYPAGTTGRQATETATGGNGMGIGTATEIIASPSTTGTRTFQNCEAAEEWGAISFSIIPILNSPPSAPTNITCNGGACQGSFAETLDLMCVGSIDPDGDTVTYVLQASLGSTQIEQDTTNVNVGGGFIENVYTTVGSDTYVVPAGVTQITVTAWGAGGGGGAGGSHATNGVGGDGGGAAHARGTINVTPAETLQVFVGGGGLGGVVFGTTTAGGGGGSGGGRSEVNRSTTQLIVAAGGGGGGGGDNSAGGGSGPGGDGGPGGAATGTAGGTSGTAGGGGGGTQTTGGAAGTGGASSGSAGSANTGGLGGDENLGTNGGGVAGGAGGGGAGGLGSAAAYGGGGGGGAGYFGGGGGSSSTASEGAAGAGGGGSSFSSGGSNGTWSGSGINPPNTTDTTYGGSAGVAGTGDGPCTDGSCSGNAGNDGRVVIRYLPTESNGTFNTLTDVNGDFISVNNITITVEVDSFNPEGSVSAANLDPDLKLEVWNGSDYINLGLFDLPSTYTGSGLDNTDNNFSIVTENSQILAAWVNSTNQDLRIQGVFLDSVSETTADEINYTNVYIAIDGIVWTQIGNHTEGNNFTLNISDIGTVNNLDLRCTAVDTNGTGEYSGFAEPDIAINVSPTSQEPPTTPTNIACNGGSCNGNFSNNIDLLCSGSTDPNGDNITYSVYYADVQEPKIGTWTDTAGTHDIGNNLDTWQKVPFNNEVSADSIYTQAATDTDITVSETGHYLIIYNIHATSDYNGRMGWESRVAVDGGGISHSYGSAFLRNTANDDVVFEGGAIVEITSTSQNISIETNYRTDDGDQVATLVASETALQIVRLDDNWDYFIANKSANQNINSETDWINLTWEDDVEQDAGFTHPVASDDAQIQLNDGGHYLILSSYGVTSSNRISLLSRVEIDGTPLNTAYGYAYHRNSDGHQEANPWLMSIFNASTGSILQVQALQENEPAPLTANTNEYASGIAIVKLPDSANYYQAFATSDRNPSAAASYALVDVIDTEVEEDAAYSGSTTGEIDIQSGYEGDFLFVFSGLANRSGTGRTRSIPQLGWHVNDADAGLGSIGWYSRGSQSTQDTYRGGGSGAFILDNSGADQVELRGRELGDGGADEDALKANQYGIMAVRLSDLFVNTSFIGMHQEGENLSWDISTFPAGTTFEQLICSASDPLGSNTSSANYTQNVNITVDVSDLDTPNVTNPTPTQGATFSPGTSVTINATITDAGTIATTQVNITFPNGTIITQTLPSTGGTGYGLTFTNTDELGMYNITYIAIDDAGNENSSITTFFDITTGFVLDVVDKNGVPINASINVVANSSGLLNISVTPSNYNIEQLVVLNYDESSSTLNELFLENQTNDSQFILSTFGIDPGQLVFEEMNVTILAEGEFLYKCTNYSFNNQTCRDADQDDGEGYEIFVDNMVPGQNYTFTINATDPGFGQGAASLDIGLTVLDRETIVIAFVDDTDDDVSFQIKYTNGTNITSVVDVDTTLAATPRGRVAVSAINTTHFVVGWADDGDALTTAKFSIYDISGTLITGPTSVDTDLEQNNGNDRVDLSIAQLGDRFAYCYANDDDNDADYQIFDNDGGSLVGESNADAGIAPNQFAHNLIDCAAVNATAWSYLWYDDAGGGGDDITFETFTEGGTTITANTDIDTAAGTDAQVAVTGLDNDSFAMVWFDDPEDDITISVRHLDNSVLLAPTDIDTDAGTGDPRVAISTIEVPNQTSDSFVVAWVDLADSDIKAAVYNKTGAAITAPFTVTSQQSTSFVLLDVLGKNTVLEQDTCPGTFTIAFTNSTSQGEFQTFLYNGSTWDGECNVPPVVFNEVPPGGTLVGRNESIEIGADVIATLGVDTVLANITFPNGTIQQVTLSFTSGNSYNSSFTTPNLIGTFNVTFFANDSGNYINDSEFTWFITNNTVPTHTNPLLNASFGGNSSALPEENLTCFPQNTADADGDPVKNIFNWYRNGTSIAALNLPFEGGSNTTFTRDYSSYSNNGNVSGAAWSANGGYDGRGAYVFDGISDSILVDDIDFGDEMSGALWVNFNDVTNQQMLVSQSALIEYQLQMQGTGNNELFRIRVDTAGGNAIIDSSTQAVAGTWYHVAWTYDGLNTTIFVNGVIENATSTGSGLIDDINENVGIGSRNDGASFPTNGTIDEVMIFNYSLSPEQVLALYENRTDYISANQTILGDVWMCEVTPNDGLEDGQTLQSNNITIVSPTLNVTLNHPPENYFNDTSSLIEFNCSAEGSYPLDTISLYLTNGNNQSFSLYQSTSVSGTSASAQYQVPLAVGNYTWNCFAEDGLSAWGENRTLKINYTDVTPPNVTSIQPVDEFFGSSTSPINFQCSAIDDFFLHNITLYIQNSTESEPKLFNTSNLSGISDSASWNNLLSPDNYTWSCQAYDDAGNGMFGENRTLTVNTCPAPDDSIGIYTGYSEYYIPGGEDQLWGVFEDLPDAPPGNTGMHSIISVTASTANTTVYYDHWEDGYDLNTSDPLATADEVHVITAAGGVMFFENSSIPVDPRGNATYYDGKDRIFVAGGAVSVARASWPESVGPTLGIAFEVYPISALSNEYTIPVGEDLAAAPTLYDDFDSVFLVLMATEDNTTIIINDPSNAGIELNVTIDRGETTNLSHTNTSTIVNSTKPVNVQYIVGDRTETYEVRGYSAAPDLLWDNEYYNPVGNFNATSTELYIINPYTTNLTITYEDKNGTGLVEVSPQTTISYTDLVGRAIPVDSGVYLTSDKEFFTTGSVGTESPDFDWGYSLVPVDRLTRNYFLGWSPGSSNTPPVETGSPIFVTPVESDTQIFVDFSPVNGTPDASFTVDRLEVLKLYDPDNDSTGTHIFTQDGKLFAVAWGQDPDTATPFAPFLDLGYTVLPLPVEWIDPVLGVNVNSSPQDIALGEGQLINFTIEPVAHDYAVEDINFYNTLPDGFVYVNGSTMITFANGTIVSGPAVDPIIDGQNLAWLVEADVFACQSLSLTFTANTTDEVTYGTYFNQASVSGTRENGTQVFSPTTETSFTIQFFTIDKDTQTPLAARGNQVNYSVKVTNIGNETLSNITIFDTLPNGFEYLSETLTESNATRFNTIGPSVGNNSLLWGFWNISANGSVTINFTVNVTNAASGGTSENTVFATSTERGTIDDIGSISQDANTPANEDPEDDEDVTITSISDFNITKTVSSQTARPGDNLTYNITLLNEGPDNATDIFIGEQLPGDVTFTESSPLFNLSTGQNYTWIVSNLGVNETFNITINVSVNNDADEPLVNVVNVSSEESGDPDGSDNSFNTTTFALCELTGIVSDATGAAVSSTTEVVNASGDVIASGTENYAYNVSCGVTYSFIVTPSSGSFNQLTINNFTVADDITDIVDLEDSPETIESAPYFINWTQAIAWKPNRSLVYDSVTINMSYTGSNDGFYYCNSWNYTNRTCIENNWNRTVDLPDGANDYIITLPVGAYAAGAGPQANITSFIRLYDVTGLNESGREDNGTFINNYFNLDPIAFTPGRAYRIEILLNNTRSNTIGFIDDPFHDNIPGSLQIDMFGSDAPNISTVAGSVTIEPFSVLNVTGTEGNSVKLAWNNTDRYVISSLDPGDQVRLWYVVDYLNVTNQTNNATFVGFVFDTDDNVTQVNTFSAAEDGENPIVNLTAPLNGTITTDININFTCDITDNFALQNVTFYWNESGSFVADGSVQLNGTGNATVTFEKSDIISGQIDWNCLAYDTTGNSDWGDHNYTVLANASVYWTPDKTLSLGTTTQNATDLLGLKNITATGEHSTPLVLCESGDCTEIITNFTTVPLTNEDHLTYFTCLTDQVGNFTANYSVFSTVDTSRDYLIINCVIIDDLFPNVTGRVPTTGSIVDGPTIIEVGANVTDDVGVNTVFANITFPNSTTVILNLTLSTGDFYNASLSVPFLGGQYNITFFANDTLDQVNQSETTFFIVNIDDAGPAWFNATVAPPTPATYAPLQNYQFNVTWIDNASISNVTVEHNFTGTLANFTVSGNLIDEYFYNFTDLAVGSYVWRMHANDSLGNINETDLFVYEVIQANSTINLTFNGTQGNTTIAVDDALNITGELITPAGEIIQLYLNGTLIANGTSPLSNVSLFNASGFFNVTAQYDGNQNYTGSFETWFVTVGADQFPSVINLTPIAGTTINMSTTIEIGANITDDIAVSNASINLTYPNGTTINIQINNSVGDIYNTSFMVPGLIGRYNVTFISNDSIGQINQSETTFFIVTEGVPPNVTNLAPANNSIDNNGDVNFRFNATDNDIINNCSVYINGTPTQTLTPITQGVEQSIVVTGLSNGTILWHVECIDQSGNTGVSQNWTLNIIQLVPNGTFIINETIQDADDNDVPATIELIDISSQEPDVITTSGGQPQNISAGIYNINITPDNNTINSILIRNVTVTGNLFDIIDIDMFNETNFVNNYAVDPLLTSDYVDINLSVTSVTGDLFICETWDFDTRTCPGGAWQKIRNMDRNINYTVTTNATIAYAESNFTINVLRRNLFLVNNTQNITQENGIIVAVDIDTHDLNFTNLTIRGHNLTNIDNDVIIDEVSNDTGWDMNYVVDPSPLNFDNATFARVANGTSVWKCTDYNFTDEDCEVDLEKVSAITPGQFYTVFFNSTDPVFIEQPDDNSGKDTRIRRGTFDTNYGTANHFRVNGNLGNGGQHSLVEFNLSNIPEGVRVDDAYVQLFFYQSNNLNNITIGVHQVLNNWTELNTTWNSRDGITNWTTPGADFDNRSYDNHTFTDNFGFFQWNITELADAWVNGSIPNYGMLFKAEIEGIGSVKRFRSSNFGANATQRPLINITFTDIQPPNVTLIHPPNGAYNDSFNPASIFFQCNATDNLNLTNISMYITNEFNMSFALNQSANITGTSGEGNFTALLPNGNYTWNCLASDEEGLTAFAQQNFTLLINASLSDTPPTWFEAINVTPGVYTPLFNTTLNVTWTDELGVDNVTFEHNFTGVLVNITVPLHTGTTLNGTYVYGQELGAGSYTWRSYAFDTSGLLNITDYFNFTILQQNGSINLTLNDTDGNLTIIENFLVNISGVLINPPSDIIQLYFNGSLIVNGSSPQWNITNVTQNGTFNVSAIFAGNQNYTPAIDTHFIIALPDHISNFNETAVSITDVSAVIQWLTDTFGNSSVNFGTTTSLGTEIGQDDNVVNHSVLLSGLSPNTLYFYNVTSCTPLGTCNTTGVFNFTTAEQVAATGVGDRVELSISPDIVEKEETALIAADIRIGETAAEPGNITSVLLTIKYINQTNDTIVVNETAMTFLQSGIWFYEFPVTFNATGTYIAIADVVTATVPSKTLHDSKTFFVHSRGGIVIQGVSPDLLQANQTRRLAAEITKDGVAIEAADLTNAMLNIEKVNGTTQTFNTTNGLNVSDGLLYIDGEFNDTGVYLLNWSVTYHMELRSAKEIVAVVDWEDKLSNLTVSTNLTGLIIQNRQFLIDLLGEMEEDRRFSEEEIFLITDSIQTMDRIVGLLSDGQISESQAEADFLAVQNRLKAALGDKITGLPTGTGNLNLERNVKSISTAILWIMLIAGVLLIVAARYFPRGTLQEHFSWIRMPEIRLPRRPYHTSRQAYEQGHHKRRYQVLLEKLFAWRDNYQQYEYNDQFAPHKKRFKPRSQYKDPKQSHLNKWMAKRKQKQYHKQFSHKKHKSVHHQAKEYAEGRIKQYSNWRQEQQESQYKRQMRTRKVPAGEILHAKYEQAEKPRRRIDVLVENLKDRFQRREESEYVEKFQREQYYDKQQKKQEPRRQESLEQEKQPKETYTDPQEEHTTRRIDNIIDRIKHSFDPEDGFDESDIERDMSKLEKLGFTIDEQRTNEQTQNRESYIALEPKHGKLHGTNRVLRQLKEVYKKDAPEPSKRISNEEVDAAFVADLLRQKQYEQEEAKRKKNQKESPKAKSIADDLKEVYE